MLVLSSRPAHSEESSGAARLFATAGAGIGYVGMRFSDYDAEGYGETHRIELSGTAVEVDAILGFGASDNVVLGIGYFGLFAIDPSGTDREFFDGTVPPERDATGSLKVEIAGPVVRVYVDHKKHVYVQAAVGYSAITYESSPEYVSGPQRLSDRRDASIGFVVGAGYEFRVGRRFAVGPGIWAIGVPAVGDHDRGATGTSATGVALTVGATYF
jgi:hypothetical protein